MFLSHGTHMRSNSEINVSSAQRIYYSRGRRFARFTSHIITGMFVLWGLWFLIHTFQDPAFFAPLLVIFIPVAIYTTAYYYALTDTCVITSETGIEYKRPEFSILATWSQIKSLKHNPFLSIFGINHYLLLDDPTISYTKWFGAAYRFQLSQILFPMQQKSIPIGKMWESSKGLENEIHTKIPSLSFESPRGRVAG